MKGKYLITTDHWFVAPNGLMYNAVWGEVEIIEDSFLGIKTNRNSSNWFAKISGERDCMIVAGCQIHYAMKCEDKPHTGTVRDWQSKDNEGIIEFERPTKIWVVA